MNADHRPLTRRMFMHGAAAVGLLGSTLASGCAPADRGENPARDTALRFRGIILPDGRETEIFVVGGLIRTAPQPDAQTVADGGYLLPGLVDAHCHIGLSNEVKPVGLDEAYRDAVINRDGGALLLRDCGSPLDTRPLQDKEELPRIIRAGRHIARPNRHYEGVGVELSNPDDITKEVITQARYGDGWVKIAGDSFDPDTGELTPLWTDKQLADAVAVAHQHGAKVTAHVMGEDAGVGLVNAGIDCLEHGFGLTDATINEMARRGTALIPTVLNQKALLGTADGPDGKKSAAYAAHLRKLHKGLPHVVKSALDAGVPMYAGSDAGGGIVHGLLVDEIIALHKTVGMEATTALGAGSWATRTWLGYPDLVDGAPADLMVFDDDPRKNLEVLRNPRHVVLRGKVL